MPRGSISYFGTDGILLQKVPGFLYIVPSHNKGNNQIDGKLFNNMIYDYISTMS